MPFTLEIILVHMKPCEYLCPLGCEVVMIWWIELTKIDALAPAKLPSKTMARRLPRPRTAAITESVNTSRPQCDV